MLALTPNASISLSLIPPPLLSQLKAASILVGIHPDQATEPIVDAALAFGKSFAVLPCCVFPNQNPHRFLPTGTPDCHDSVEAPNPNPSPVSLLKAESDPNKRARIPVRTYDQFVSYLLAKDPSIRVGQLPFEGRNLVLYRIAQYNKDLPL